MLGFPKKGTLVSIALLLSAEARDKLQPLISADFKDKDVLPIKDKSPHITIVDITKTGAEDLTKENIFLQICSQNPQIADLIDHGNEFNILFIKSDSKSNKCTAVVRVSCCIRDFIKANRNRIYIGINSCRVFDRFYVKRCNKCQKFGHFKDSCPNQATCGFCSQNHESHTCCLKDESDFTKLRCINCKRDNFTDVGHSTFWTKCPSYAIAQKRLKSTIPYYDNASTAGQNLSH